MRFPWGFNPPKESFETRTLIGRMWKRSNALSWPILIAREAWSYNLKSWSLLESFKVVLKQCNQLQQPIKSLLLPICLRQVCEKQTCFTRWALKSSRQLNGCLLCQTITVMSGGHSELEPPLPISNRAVKRFCANDSMLFACESRSPPGYLFNTLFVLNKV